MEPAPEGSASATDWRLHGVRVVRGTELDPNTPQTPGMSRAAAINTARAGAEKLWAERLEYTAEAGPGDFIYVPPYVPHQEINASAEIELSCVVVRSGQEPIVVNLDLPDVEPNPVQIHWVDDIHRAPDQG
jgi:uncharacterized RmlC-like cupin family protein